MVITFFEMENYYDGQLTTWYSLSDYRVPWLTTGYSTWNSKSSLIMLIYTGIKGMYGASMASNIVYLHTKFHWIWLKIKEIIGHTLTSGRLLRHSSNVTVELGLMEARPQ